MFEMQPVTACEPLSEVILTYAEKIHYPISDPGMMSLYSTNYHMAQSNNNTSVMPEQTNHPSLFRSSSELPSFHVSYRWWEDEATTVLWAFDIQEIKRVIRYGLFSDETIPRMALHSRNISAIDNFLLTLIEPHESVFLPNLSDIQKIEEILRRSKINSPPLVAWSWFPSHRDRGLDPRALAMAIDSESHLHFTRISFEELIRYSLGYPAVSVEWFLQQHTAFYIHLLNYLLAYPEELERYAEVEKFLRDRSPFAHRALVTSLLAVQPEKSLQLPPNSNKGPAFEFIAGPLQFIFKNLPPSLSTVLKVLSILEVRFQQSYVHVREMNWTQPFDSSVNFLEGLLGSSSAVDYARTLTNIDESDFSKLTQQGIIENGPVALHLADGWDLLSKSVWECCVAIPDLIPYIHECAGALFAIRNYHSFTAILDGLQKFSITDFTFTSTNLTDSSVTPNPVIATNFKRLMDPFQNYIVYRQQFMRSPGIPYLFPHLREFKQGGLPALRQFFHTMRLRAN